MHIDVLLTLMIFYNVKATTGSSDLCRHKKIHDIFHCKNFTSQFHVTLKPIHHKPKYISPDRYVYTMLIVFLKKEKRFNVTKIKKIVMWLHAIFSKVQDLCCIIKMLSEKWCIIIALTDISCIYVCNVRQIFPWKQKQKKFFCSFRKIESRGK